MNYLNKIPFYLAMVTCSLLGFSWFLGMLGLRINVSSSIPVGFYWKTETPVEKGNYVIFCPPVMEPFDIATNRGYINIGFCENGYGYMMKKVTAIEGDVVSITSKGVYINKKRVENSKPYIVDKNNHTLPLYHLSNRELQQDEVLLMGETRASFDARYFGPINISQIKGVIYPVLTWGEK